MEYKLSINFGDTGEDAYNRKYVRKINKVLSDNTEDSSILYTFANYMISQDKSYCTAYQYIKIVQKFMKDTGKTAEKLVYDDFSNYLAAHKESGASLKRTLHACLAAYSEMLCKTRRIEWNYMASIKAPRYKESRETKAKREESFLTVEEMKDMVRCAEKGLDNKRSQAKTIKERDVAILKLLIITGMRCSALYKLNVDNFVAEKKLIRTVEKRDDEQDYYLDDDVCECIKEWIRIRKELLADNPNEKALFVSVIEKQRLDQSSIWRLVRKYAEAATGRAVSPHKIRASFATILYDIKKDIYFVQEAMRHSSPDVTKLYIRGKKKEVRQESANLVGHLMNW